MINVKDLKKENSLEALVANYKKVYLYAIEEKIRRDAASGYKHTTIFTNLCTDDIRDGKKHCFPRMKYIYDYAHKLGVTLCCDENVIKKAERELRKELKEAGYKIKDNLLLMGTPGLNASYGYEICW